MDCFCGKLNIRPKVSSSSGVFFFVCLEHHEMHQEMIIS